MSSISESPTGCNQDISQASWGFSQSLPGEGSASKLAGSLTKFSSLRFVGQRATVLGWILAKSHPEFPVMWTSSTCFIKVCKPKKEQKMYSSKIKVIVFQNLILEVTSSQPSFILLAGNHLPVFS